MKDEDKNTSTTNEATMVRRVLIVGPGVSSMMSQIVSGSDAVRSAISQWLAVEHGVGNGEPFMIEGFIVALPIVKKTSARIVAPPMGFNATGGA